MTTQDILDATEHGRSLFLASDSEIGEALQVATREIHRYALGRELKYRHKRRRVTNRTDGMVHGQRRKGKCPRKRDLR